MGDDGEEGEAAPRGRDCTLGSALGLGRPDRPQLSQHRFHAGHARDSVSRPRERSVGQRSEGSVERRAPSPSPFDFGTDWRGTGGNGRQSVGVPRGGPRGDLRRTLAGCLGAALEEALSPDLTPRSVSKARRLGRPCWPPCDLVSGTRINLLDRPHSGPRFNMTTTVGIRSKDGVVLAADKRASKGFFVGSKVVQKIFSLDGATAVAIAGAMSDAEYLVNLAKAERRLLALRRGYPLSVKESAKLISNIVYSSMKSYNPFYVELVVAGVDREGAHVYTSDMSGAITSEDFMSSGSGSPIAYGVLEQGFRKEFSLDEARKLAEAAVRAAMERDPGSGNGVDVLAIPNGHAFGGAN